MSSVATTAWMATGQPRPVSPPDHQGPCGCCGHDGELWPAREAISKSFTGYDSWTHPGQPWLCAACCWSYATKTLRLSAHLVRRRPDQVSATTGSRICQVLIRGPIDDDLAVVVPLRPGRRHLLHTAQFSHVTIDTGKLPWTQMDALLLRDYLWLRHLGFTADQISERAPNYRQLVRITSSEHSSILNTWQHLAAWRVPDSPWLALAGRISKEIPMTLPHPGTSPLYSVTATTGSETHLAAGGPDLLGTHPERLAPATLCGAVPLAPIRIGAGEVTCERCLQRAPQFMTSPGWSSVQ